MELSTYKGDVPISPKIIPRAMSKPAVLTRLCEDIFIINLNLKSIDDLCCIAWAG